MLSTEEQIENSNKGNLTDDYEKMLMDVDLPKSNKGNMLLYPTDKKEYLLSTYQEAVKMQNTDENSPEYFLCSLKCFLATESTFNNLHLLKCMESLKIALGNYTLGWKNEFGVEGLKTIVSILELTTKKNNVELEKLCLKCIYKFINNADSHVEFSHLETAHKTVANCLDYRNELVMLEATKILIILSFTSPEKLLMAIKKNKDEEDINHFLPLVEGITMTSNVKLWGNCLILINTILEEISDQTELQLTVYDKAVLSEILNKKGDFEQQDPDFQKVFEDFEHLMKK